MVIWLVFLLATSVISTCPGGSPRTITDTNPVQPALRWVNLSRSDYGDGLDCTITITDTDVGGWLACTGAVEIDVPLFSTQPFNDVLTIYDGVDTSSPLMGSFSGDGFKSGPRFLRTTSPSMTMRFQSDSSVSGDTYGGFAIRYTFICSPSSAPQNKRYTELNCPLPYRPTIYSAVASVQDNVVAVGSATLQITPTQYANNCNCAYYITHNDASCPAEKRLITLSWASGFSVEASHDSVVVYHGQDSSVPFSQVYSGLGLAPSNPSGPPAVTYGVGQLYVTFVTDAVNSNFGGWSVDIAYSCEVPPASAFPPQSSSSFPFSSSVAPSSSGGTPTSSSSLSGGAIAGIIVGVAVAVGLIGWAYCCLCRVRRVNLGKPVVLPTHDTGEHSMPDTTASTNGNRNGHAGELPRPTAVSPYSQEDNENGLREIRL